MADTSSYFASDSACRTDDDCGAGIVNAYYAVLESIRMLTVPKVAVIEFYNAALDHFFIAAASQPDVPALDSGAIPGWSRTGRTFNGVSRARESGLAGVCRFYIPPAKGNSHFYSASADRVRRDLRRGVQRRRTRRTPRTSGFVYETGGAFVVDHARRRRLPADARPGVAPVEPSHRHQPPLHDAARDPQPDARARATSTRASSMCALP